MHINTTTEHTDQEGFTKVNSRKRPLKKPSSQPNLAPASDSIPSSSNSFNILAHSDPSAPELPFPSSAMDIHIPPSENPLQGILPSQHRELPQSSLPSGPDKTLICKPNSMEIDNQMLIPNPAVNIPPKSGDLKQMEEDLESIDLGEFGHFLP